MVPARSYHFTSSLPAPFGCVEWTGLASKIAYFIMQMQIRFVQQVRVQ